VVQQTEPQNTVWKGLLAVCSKRFSAYHVNEPVIESDKHIPRFASLKNDDYDSDNKALMPIEEDDDFYIQTINSDNERDSDGNSIPYNTTDDDSTNGSFHEEPTRISDDEKVEDQYDFDEWFEEQMDVNENGSEKSTGKEDYFVKFFNLDNITSNSLMNYENKMTENTALASYSTRNARCYPVTNHH